MQKITDISACKEFVRENVDLFTIIDEDVGKHIGDEVQWSNEGTDTVVTTSPFRDESKPSFKVRGDRFKDWGGEQYSGDIFAWVQLWHGLNFIDSIKHVASRFSLDISKFQSKPTPEEQLIGKYKNIYRIAAEWMHQCLIENALVREKYFGETGFNIEIIKPYQIGYCPNVGALINAVSKETQLSSPDVDILELSRMDLFNDAIVYPIHNHNGEVVSFYTRQINIDNAPYKGMRASNPLHDPSILYGFFIAKKTFREHGPNLTIVEGFKDAIVVPNGAGVMGGAITEPQIQALKDHNIKNVNVCYDGDNPGMVSTLKLIKEPPDFGSILVLISRPPLNQDPHEVWVEGSSDAIVDMLDNPKVPLEFYVETYYDVSQEISLTDQYQLLSGVSDYLVNVSGIHLDVGCSYLSRFLTISKESILDHIVELKASYSKLYNIEAERVVIVYCMNSSSYLSTFRAAGVTEDAFTLSKYRKIFDACCICYDKFGVNYTAQAVLDEVMARYAIADMPDFVTKIFTDAFKYTEAAACDIVLDMWRRRTAANQADKLKDASRDLSIPFVEVVNDHRRQLISTVASSRPQAKTPSELSDEAFHEIKEREKAGGDLIIGHSFSGMSCINMILGGIQEGHMTTIAGDTGDGKSVFAMNMLKSIAVDHNVPTMWIGQEMKSMDNTMRLISMITGIHNTRVQTGNLTQDEAKLVADARKIIASSGYHMFKPRDGTIDEILAAVDEYRFKYGIRVVVWDYIQLVQQAEWQSRISREQIIGHASKVVKNRMTEDMGLAVVAISQQNRDSKQTGKKGVAGSYQISQDTDNFMEIIAKTKKQIAEDGETQGNRYIAVEKRRGGAADIRINAFLDIDPRTVTLRLTECMAPSDQAKLFSQLAH
jgi:DNA primase catalytic core